MASTSPLPLASSSEGQLPPGVGRAMSRSAPSVVEDGPRLAARLVGLGCLRPPPRETLVLDSPSQGRFSAVLERALSSLSPWSSGSSPKTAFFVEEDLVLQDLDDDISPPQARGRLLGRSLMQQRAQQCMVCMDEKEHTFVPTHRAGTPSHLQGHRFCSDCWVDFLQHRLGQCMSKQATGKMASLVCPVCRDEILVPDYLSAECDLPAAWCTTSRPRLQAVEVPSELAPAICLAPTSNSSSRPSSPGWLSSQGWFGDFGPREVLPPHDTHPKPIGSNASDGEWSEEAEQLVQPHCRAFWAATVRCFRDLVTVAVSGPAPASGFLQC